ncbi:MAG: biopolymer transporter ExbD [Dysgonamonadaceae bacterium]|jgi:biopolymer transport protein ExbD|nr:biopolymer transporter ExbD [Dysgonamonadaceae bacterium]
MLIRRKKREIPQVNSSASADIAFLLLVFFLIASSMGTEKGIFRRLLPKASEDIPRVRKEIQERDLLVLKIDSDNQLYCNDIPLDISGLKKVATDFISNPDDDDSLPERHEKEITFLGMMPVTSNHVISLQVSRDADYDAYVSVQNELSAAYNQLRNELSLSRFGKIFAVLDAERQLSVREVYPQRITESELSGEAGNDDRKKQKGEGVK